MKKEKERTGEWEEVKATDYAPWIDWDTSQVIIGKVKDKRQIEWEGKRKYVIEVEADVGGIFSIGETGLLKLGNIQVGDVIKIENNGWTKLKSGRRARDLRLYVKKVEPF